MSNDDLKMAASVFTKLLLMLKKSDPKSYDTFINVMSAKIREIEEIVKFEEIVKSNVENKK